MPAAALTAIGNAGHRVALMFLLQHLLAEYTAPRCARLTGQR